MVVRETGTLLRESGSFFNCLSNKNNNEVNEGTMQSSKEKEVVKVTNTTRRKTPQTTRGKDTKGVLRPNKRNK